jgi:RNA polymerase sigma-70 factor (ECF subfamily)
MEGLETRLGDWTTQVQRFLLARFADRELCRDLAQEAAARLVRAWREGQPIEDPRAWMFRAARNLAVDAVRRRLPSPLGLELAPAVPDPASLDEASEEPCWELGGREVPRSELVALLPAALAHLPDHYRRALAGRYDDGLSCEAVAVRERISEPNLKVRLHRARRRLRDLLERQLERRGEGA